MDTPVIIGQNQVNPPLAVSKYKAAYRNTILDVARGMAILMVILSHLTLVDKPIVTTVFFKYIQNVFSVIKIGGWSGVDLFFCIKRFSYFRAVI